MKIGMFGYPGDHLERTKAVCAALKAQGAGQLVCLGGLVWSGRRMDEQGPPVTVLRWLRSQNIPTLANETDRQVAGWRLQALGNTTGFIQPRIRKFLGEITREEAQWLYGRPQSLPFGQVLCCADILTIDALFPVPLTRFNAAKLFAVLEQKAAFFPSANGPTVLARKLAGNSIEAGKYEDVEEQLDDAKVAGMIGGITGYPPLNGDVCWAAVVDSEATQLSLLCLDAKMLKPVPERAALLLQRSEVKWRE